MSSSLPFIIFAVPTLIAGVLVLFLPETRGHPLTQTLEEGEHFVRKNKMKFCRLVLSACVICLCPERFLNVTYTG